MFTGIIRGVGEIETVLDRGGDARIGVVCADIDFSAFSEGESIAVSGVCLTALELEPGRFVADVSRETLDITTLGRLATGARVNLEPALALGERMGGHLVSGHVDCIGQVTARSVDARSVRLRITLPRGYCRYIARKGSVALDGVSLTVNTVKGDSFDLNIIPHTMSVTTLADVKVGDAVNIEVDLMARYLERLVETSGSGEGLGKNFLERHGYGE